MAEPKPTLSDLDNTTPPAPGITPGSGEPAPADLAAQQAAQQAAADAARLTELEAIAEDQLTEEQKTELEALKKTLKPDATGDGDGNDDDDDDNDDPGGNDDPIESAKTFLAEIDKLRGEEIPVNWDEYKDKEGNIIDPLSPEGLLIREKAVEKIAIEKFEKHLMGTDPRAYAYILHRQAGGTDEEFFATKTLDLPDYTEFTNSVDLQQKVYTDDLIRKGVTEKQAKLLAEQAIKDKEIFELADKAYKEQQKAHEKQLDDVAKKLADEQLQYEKSVKVVNSLLEAEISGSGSMKLIVPDAKKAEFNQFVRSHINTADGKFYAVQELTKESLPRILEGLFLNFVNGDLSGIVQRKAQTIATNTLRARLGKEKQTPSDGTPRHSGKKVLGDL